MKTPTKSIDDYLASVPSKQRSVLARVRSIVRKAYKAFVAFRASKAQELRVS